MGEKRGFVIGEDGKPGKARKTTKESDKLCVLLSECHQSKQTNIKILMRPGIL